MWPFSGRLIRMVKEEFSFFFFRGHQAAVLCVHFNDTKVVSGSCDKTIKVS